MTIQAWIALALVLLANAVPPFLAEWSNARRALFFAFVAAGDIVIAAMILIYVYRGVPFVTP